MERRFFLSDTWQGAIFGTALLVLFWTIFVGPQLIAVLEYAFPGLSLSVIFGLSGGLAGGLIATPWILESYWEWADSVMARLFRRSADSSTKT